MKHHAYQITTEWTGNEGTGTTTYRSYSRNHTISSTGNTQQILGSSDPAFLGDPTRFNPEELFLASVSSCHMLWYLHLCASNGIIVHSYLDQANGTMIEGQDGGGKFDSITLQPEITIGDKDQVALATQLHEQANQLCFIANSLNFKVEHQPTILLHTPS